MTKTPWVGSQTLCSPQASQPGRMRRTTQAGVPRSEAQRRGTQSESIGVLWIADQNSWEAADILEQMVLSCNHRLQVGLAHICTDVAEMGRRLRRKRKRRGVRCSWELSRCGRKRAFMYLPCLTRVGIGVFYKHEKDYKIQLNAFLRQPVVSPYLTSVGLAFLGVTTKAHFPAQAAEAHRWMYQLGMRTAGCLRPALMPRLPQPYRWWETHSVLGWGGSGGMRLGSQSMFHLPQNSEGFKAPPFCLLCCLGGQWLSMVAGKDGW